MIDSIQTNRTPWHRRLGLQSLSLRIVLAIAAVALFGIGTAAIAIWQTEAYRAELNRADEIHEAEFSLQQAGTAWLLATNLADDYVAAPDPALRGEIVGISALMLASIDESLRVEVKLGDDDAVEMTATREALAGTIPALLSAFDQADSGQQEEARATLAQLKADTQPLGLRLAEHVQDEQAEVADIVASANSAARTLSRINAVAVALMLIFSVAVSMVTGQWILRPLTNLRRTALAVGEGDLTARAEVTGPIEVRELGTVLNSMTSRIEERDAALRQSEGYWRSLINNAQDAIVVLNLDGTIRFVSPAVEQMLGYTPKDITGKDAFELVHPDDRDIPRDTFDKIVGTGKDSQSTEFRMGHKNGEWRFVEALGALVDGDEKMIVINARDITERRRAQDTITHMAYHDALTGLPNRLLLQDRFEVAIARARRSAEKLCILTVDIDRFKVVNDTLGHAAGDAVLKETAGRLTNLVREGDTVARQGGDEFLLLLTGMDSSENSEALAERIVAAFHQPIELEGIEYHSAVSVGLAVYPDDGDNADALTNAADAAMYAAKDAGRDTFRVYDAGMSRHDRDWIELETELRRALQMDEIEVFYQPQIRIESNGIVGVEALARWRHPSRGLVSPAEFIPIAEETGLIVPLGEQVLTRAISDFMQWDRDGIAPVRLSVNVSAHQIERPDFVQRIAAILTDTGLPAGRLDLEITETTALKDMQRTKEVADELAAMGVSIAIDDFGTGSTSLRYLNDLPVRTVKIDLMFVRDMIENPSSAAIVKSVIALGHQLSLNVIAEGVETNRQLAVLRRHACDEFQGFLSSRPIPAQEIRKFLETGEIRESVQREAAEGSAAAPIVT